MSYQRDSGIQLPDLTRPSTRFYFYPPGGLSILQNMSMFYACLDNEVVLHKIKCIVSLTPKNVI